MNDVSGNRPTSDLAEFVSDVECGDLTGEHVAISKLAMLDTIAVTVAAAGSETAQRIATFANKYGGRAVSTIIGRHWQCDPPTAALVNGTMGHALDYDDISWTMNGHPSVVVLPAVLAIAEEYHLSGRELLLGYAVGCEVAIKLGKVLNPEHYAHGWHGTGTLGTLGAAAGVAKLLRLDVGTIKHALAIAASSAGGLRQNFGTDTKPFHAGNGARAGLVAAGLAADGFTGDPSILESRWGYFNVFRPESSSTVSSELGRELGRPWARVDPGVLLKMYPTCVSTHTAIGAAINLQDDHDIDPTDVEEVDVATVDFSTKILIHDRPQTPLEAKFSMQYCVARALVSGAVSLAHFTKEAVRDPVVKRLSERVTMHADRAMSEAWLYGTPRPAEVRVTLRDGTQLVRRVDIPAGNPGKLDREMVMRKFSECLAAGPRIGEAGEVERSVMELEELDDVAKFMSELAGI